MRQRDVLGAAGSALLVAVATTSWWLLDAGDDRSTGRLALYKGNWSGDDAAMTGTVSIEGSCFYVLSGADSPRYLVAFSTRGAEWDEGGQALRVGDLLLHHGDPYRSGGGEGPRDPSLMDWEVPPDPSCDTSNLWIAGRPHR